MKEGWEILDFEKCLLKVPSTAKIPKKKFLTEGAFPIVSQEEEYINGYWDDEDDVFKVEKPVVLFGDHTKIVKLVDFDFVKGADGIKVFLPKEDINSKFFAYQLQSLELKDLGYARHYRLLKKKKISIPPLSEQQQIVALLDEAFAAIDQAQANIEKNIENAKELFQSKLNEIFSQKGEGWEEKVLGDIGEVQTGTTPSTKDKSNYGDYIPFAKPPHFKEDGSIDTQDSMLSKSGLEKGRLFKANSTLMVCIGATIGKTGFSEKPICSNQQINALTPTNDYVPKLLYYALISPFVQSQVMSAGKSAQATLPIINKSKWLKLKVNLPLDKSVQTQIIETLENLKESCMNTELIYHQKLANLEELKKSILQRAFSGELTQKPVAV